MKSPTILKSSFPPMSDHVCHYHPHPLRDNVEYCRVCKSIRVIKDKKKEDAFRLLLGVVAVGLIALTVSIAVQVRGKEGISPIRNFLEVVTRSQSQ
jgi:hypothetical protein